MRSICLTLTLACVAGLGASPARAQDDADRRTISVTGNAAVTAANDTAGFTTGVDARRSSPGAALSSASSTMRRVLAAIRGEEVADSDIRTRRVGVHRSIRRVGGRRIVTYVATNTVFVTVRDLKRTGATIDAAVDAGATRVSGPSFWRASTRDLYRRALVLALHKARDKAQALAADSGTTLGEVLSITESGAVVHQYTLSDSSGASAPATPIEPGRTRVTADLTAVFAMS